MGGEGVAGGETGTRSGLTVRLEDFEGPLDLLLHLARTNEIDLARLPIRQITDQYLAYLESVEFADLEESGAFLVLAATLIYLKSRLLLPAPADAEEETLEEDAEALRLELEARLRAYARVKELGAWLRDRETAWGTRFSRTWSELPMPEYLPLESLSLWDLGEAYREFLAREAQAETREVAPEGPPLLERMAEIAGVLEQSWYVLFSALLGANPPRPEVVVTLLAILELVRLQRARAQQTELFGDIVVERALDGDAGSR